MTSAIQLRGVRSRFAQKTIASRLMSMTALSAAVTLGTTTMAWSQTPAPQPAQAAPVEEIVVTGSLIVRDGYEAPTPVTVMGIEQIQQSSPAGIADYINSLPEMGGGTTTHQGGGGLSDSTKGTNSINLRGLGTPRTLVLIDGIRLPPVSYNGTTDISGIPESLVTRVDVVTGGASAAYGSDAVAGVVNFVLDKKYVGVKGEVQGGVTTYGDDRTWNVKLTAGLGFGGDRGHVLFSGDLASQDGIFGPGHGLPLQRDWAMSGWMNINMPGYTATNGLPAFYIGPNVQQANQAMGGIINTGPLKGIYFGPGGVPAMMNYGTSNNGTYMIGGPKFQQFQGDNNLDQINHRQSAYLRLSYDVTDDINVFFEANYSRSAVIFQGSGNFTSTSQVIRTGNPFIPASVQAQMTALKLTTITIGTWNGDLGLVAAHNTRVFNRYTVGATGKFMAADTSWSWDAYAQSGFSRDTQWLANDYVVARYNEAQDAVLAPNGSIVCRSTLTQPTNGCVPLNIMGIGVNSEAAVRYATGNAYLYQAYIQDAVGVNVRGEPFENWAGPVSLAFGVDWRRDAVRGKNDPISAGLAYTSGVFSDKTGYFAGNYQVTTGNFNVKEGFVETVFPLAKETSWGKSLDLNAAVRAIDYSQSGYVTTWKVGITYNPTEDIRLRATQSRDIRAPNLAELFAGGGAAAGNTIDPFLNNASYGTHTGTFGNPNLKPEKADDTGLGVVYQPSWFPGFSTSFDYYNIKIKEAIAVPANQLLRCFDGNALLCTAIVRLKPANGEPVGRVDLIRNIPFNFASERTSGFDIEATYRTPLDVINSDWAGSIGLRFLATHVISDKTDDGLGTVNEKAGVNSGGGPARWRTNMTLNYTNDPIAVTLTYRGISSGVYNNNFIVCTTGCPANTTARQTVTYNTIDGGHWFDFNVSYKFGEDMNYQVYLTIQNLMDTDPPPVAQGNQYTFPANPLLYDTIGRQFRAGVRFKL